jgi:hypothetical protein
MKARGRSYIGTAWTIRDNETAEPQIIQQDFNSSVTSVSIYSNNSG